MRVGWRIKVDTYQHGYIGGGWGYLNRYGSVVIPSGDMYQFRYGIESVSNLIPEPHLIPWTEPNVRQRLKVERKKGPSLIPHRVSNPDLAYLQ